MKEEDKKRVREITCERTEELIHQICEEFDFEKLSIYQKIQFLEQIREGVLDAADLHEQKPPAE